jgi:hypothetical protein
MSPAGCVKSVWEARKARQARSMTGLRPPKEAGGDLVAGTLDDLVAGTLGLPLSGGFSHETPNPAPMPIAKPPPSARDRQSQMHSPVRTNCVILGSDPNELVGSH